MIQLLMSKLDDRFTPEFYLHLLQEIPFPLRVKVGAYKKPQDANSSLTGKILLKKALEKYYRLGEEALNDVRYARYNRPYIPTYAVDFNISHSYPFVACALTRSGKVGVDIEKLESMNFTDFEEHFSSPEWRNICEAGDPKAKFYQYWTMKEAISKAEGIGLGMSLQNIIIQPDEKSATVFSKKWFLHSHLESDYCVSVASQEFGRSDQIFIEWVFLTGDDFPKILMHAK